jgi:hypothetical protein
MTSFFQKLKDSFKNSFNNAIGNAVAGALEAAGEKPAPKPVKKTRREAAVVFDRYETFKGPQMVRVSETMKRKVKEYQVTVSRIDWRKLDRNKYSPFYQPKEAA